VQQLVNIEDVLQCGYEDTLYFTWLIRIDHSYLINSYKLLDLTIEVPSIASYNSTSLPPLLSPLHAHFPIHKRGSENEDYHSMILCRASLRQ
jgi:hypothetical protein